MDGPGAILLFTMVALYPKQVDSSLLMRYADQQMRIGEQLEVLARRQFTVEQIKYAGYVGVPLAAVVTFRWEF
jgi:hypothetical protein